MRFALLALLVACGSRPPPTVTRILGGERRVGAFVSPYAYEHFIRAELAAATGDDATAIHEYGLARLGPQDDVLVIARLAEALDRLGRTEQAERVLREGEALDPASEAVWLARARIFAHHGQLGLAMDAAARAAELAPESDAPVLLLAELLERADATPRAAAVLRAAGDSPNALRRRLVMALAQGDGLAASEALERLLRVAPARVRDVVAAARLALDDGRPALALHLLALLPPQAQAPLRTRALLAAGRQDEAEALLRTTPADSFGGPGPHASLLLRAGLVDAAVEAAKTAVALGDIAALVVLGKARLAAGDPAGAAEAFARVPPSARIADEARAGLAEALAMGGLATVGREVARPSAQEIPQAR